MVCPNCKTEFEGGRCPNCGHSAFRTLNRIAAVVVLILLVLPTALVGACSLIAIAGSMGGSRSDYEMLVIVLAVGAMAIAACVGFILLYLRLWRS